MLLAKPYSIPPFYLNETMILLIFGMQEFFLLLKGVEGKVPLITPSCA